MTTTTTTSWATSELNRFRHDPEFELESLLLEINEGIVRRMATLGWRKSDLARGLGVSRAFVTKLLNGNQNVTLGTLVRVANALNVKIRIELLPRHIVDFLESASDEFVLDGLKAGVRTTREVNEGEQIPLAA